MTGPNGPCYVYCMPNGCPHPAAELVFRDEYGVDHFWCSQCQSLYQVAVVLDPSTAAAAVTRMDPAMVVGILMDHPECLNIVVAVLSRLPEEAAKTVVLSMFQALFPDEISAQRPTIGESDDGDQGSSRPG